MYRNYLLSALLVFSSVNAQDTATLSQTSQDFSQVAKTATPAVVSIRVKSNGARSKEPSSEEDLFSYFFGIPRNKSQGQSQLSQASGFIVSPDGYILTNNHVVHTGQITVKLNDGREFPAKVIGTDDSTDVALVKIDATALPYLKFGNSDDLSVGQWVVAIGTPLGLQATLTVGVVSAKGRSNLDLTRVEDFIQTDAALNRGNSGGPLLNLQGEVVGMNTAIATDNGLGGYMGIGFAIPSNMLTNVQEQLLSSGSVTRGYLGIILQPVDNDIAESLDLPKVEGALVAEVLKGSPAQKAGLKQGDVILKINNRPVESIGGLRNFIALQRPDAFVTLSLLRDKQPKEIVVQIGVLQAKNTDEETSLMPNSTLGMEVQTITPDMSDEKGVLVTRVDPNSSASLVGIKKGALILAVNNQKITSKEEFLSIIKATLPGKPVLLLIKQGDAIRYISIREQ